MKETERGSDLQGNPICTKMSMTGKNNDTDYHKDRRHLSIGLQSGKEGTGKQTMHYTVNLDNLHTFHPY